jgi:hypothetical protein
VRINELRLASERERDALRAALRDLERYTSQLIDCGDCGFIGSGDVPEVVAARTALQEPKHD